MEVNETAEGAEGWALREGDSAMVTLPDGLGPKGLDEESDEIARMVRDGVKPEGVKGRLRLMLDKLAGHVPMGADASSQSLRKAIAGSSELLAFIRHGLCGLLLVVFGVLFLYVGLFGPFNIDLCSIGVLLLILGVWSLRAAQRADRHLRAISKS